MGVAVSQRTEINYAAEQFLCTPHFLENIKSCTPSAREVTRGRGALLCRANFGSYLPHSNIISEWSGALLVAVSETQKLGQK